MKVDLTYANKEGISLQNILDVLTESKAKKDIQSALNTTKSIDTLLKKLEEAELIEKKKEGRAVIYSAATTELSKMEETVEEKPKKTTRKKAAPKAKEKTTKKVETTSKPKRATTKKSSQKKIDVVEEEIVETPTEEVKFEVAKPTAPKLTKAKPKADRAPAAVDKINKQTATVSKDHQITSLVEIEEVRKDKSEKTNMSDEVDADSLELLRQEMESRTGKEVTAILHKRKERAVKERKATAQEIFDKQQEKLVADAEVYDEENPFRFVLNFFTSTLNGETATPYFRRRDEYVVKSIYNKFKTLCNVSEAYALEPQNLPFYRVITINRLEKNVKIYHIDMNRIVRGVHTIFELTDSDISYLDKK